MILPRIESCDAYAATFAQVGSLAVLVSLELGAQKPTLDNDEQVRNGRVRKDPA